MYKHASYRRTAAQDRDVYEDGEFLRKNLKAAGVDPPGSESFRVNAIFTLAFWPKKRPSASKIAQKLNSCGVHNANGKPWTPMQVKMFVEAHFPSRKLPL